jgi:MYXO-CTERM domain-containing protein
MRCMLFSGVAVAALASAASADVTISFADFTATGFQFFQAAGAGTLIGSLTGVSVNAVLNSSTMFTYADDLCVYVDVLPLSTQGMVQIGGFSELGAGQRYFWPNGDSPSLGTVVSGTVTLTTAVDMTTPNLAVWLGNGYGAAGTSGTWTGSITLHGVDAVPAPGALALLGLAGLVSRGRRR